MVALVVGNGPGWENELEAIYEPSMDILAMNRSISLCPYKIKYGVSKHFVWALNETAKLDYPTNIIFLRDQKHPWGNMTSGFATIRLALQLGYDKVYVVGIPLSDPTYNKTTIRKQVALIAKELKDKVIAPEHYWWMKFLNDYKS